jgi:hypothetical protein
MSLNFIQTKINAKSFISKAKSAIASAFAIPSFAPAVV